jgi:3-dehydroquinate synthase
VPLVQVPTTLLAQVDASIGGKTSVNHPLGKNMIGSFYQPKLVWSDLTLLKTLPRKEIICGLGEIIKYGIIRDPALFTLVEQNLERILALDLTLLPEIVTRCCEIKAQIVSADEKESGLRMILNFGHTIGHALEAALEYTITHGEAVLLGMLAESKIALDSGKLPAEDFYRIRKLITSLRVQPPTGLERERLIKILASDKKAVAGQLRVVLPNKIGEVEVAAGLKEDLVRAGVEYIFDKH